jgi:hypothetical protein
MWKENMVEKSIREYYNLESLQIMQIKMAFKLARKDLES